LPECAHRAVSSSAALATAVVTATRTAAAFIASVAADITPASVAVAIMPTPVTLVFITPTALPATAATVAESSNHRHLE